MKKIILTITVFLLTISAFAQFPKPSVSTTPKRMTGHYWFMANIDTTTGGYADTLGVYLLSDTAYFWNNKGHVMADTLVWKDGTKTYSAGTASFTTVLIRTDTILGYNPLIDSCLDYLKVKRIASCSPLWLSSPDSVWITGDLRQIDGSVAFRGTSGDNPFHNDGTLFMWYGAKSALRAGYANNDAWATDSIGNRSVALGNNVKAIGAISTAFGGDNRAYGGYSFAINNNNQAIGGQSFCGGGNSFSIGGTSFAFGSNVTAYSDYSIALGANNLARKNYAFVANVNNVANGEYSAVFGSQNISNVSNQFVCGTYNDTTTAALFIVGNGGGVGAESNALEVYADSVVRTPGKFAQYKPDHAFVTYSSTGYAVKIAVQNAWMDITDSTAVRLSSVEIGDGWQNDNDTIVYNGYDDAHAKFTVSISLSGTNAHDLLIRMYNVTDGAAVHTQKRVTMTGATNRSSVTLLGYDVNANVGDRYIIQVANTSAAANITIYDIGWLCEVTHYR